LVVDFGLSRAEIAALNAGESLSRALAASKSDDTRGAVFASLPWATKRFFAVRAHEQDHLRRSLSTSYGFLGDSLRCLWLNLVGRSIAETAAQGRSPLVPVLSPSVGDGLGFDEAIRLIQGHSRSGEHRETLIVGLADLLEALTDDVDPARFASALWGLSNGDGEAARRLRGNLVGSAHPMTDKGGGKHGLAARHLLEFFAVGEHGNGFLRTGSDLPEVADLLVQDTREYSLAVLAWMSVFGRFDPPDVVDQPRLDDDLIFDWYRLFPFELIVAADLALWPPFFPDDDLSIDGVLNWTDIDPGRRFVRVLAALRDRDIVPTVIPAEGRNESFRTLQTAICADFGWPTPHDLATRWLLHLADHLERGTSPWAILDGNGTYRVENAARMLTLRLSRPADVVLNNIDFLSCGVAPTPVWEVRETGLRRSLVPMGREESRLLIPAIMLEGSRHLFGRDRLLMTPVFDAGFRRSAVEVLGAQFTSHCDWDEKLLGRFLAETHRDFRTGEAK